MFALQPASSRFSTASNRCYCLSMFALQPEVRKAFGKPVNVLLLEHVRVATPQLDQAMLTLNVQKRSEIVVNVQ